MTAPDRRPALASDLPTEAFNRLEQILDRFEAAWRSGQRPSIEEYLRGVREEERLALLVELALEDLELRQRAGESAGVEHYVQRFPELADVLPVLALQRRTHAAGAIHSAVIQTPATHAPDVATMHSPPPAQQIPSRETPPVPSSLSPPGGSAVPPIRVPGYEVLGVLGQGGMSLVLQARQRSLGRLVALKVIRYAALAGEEERRRFRTEAEAVARLQHPNILHIYDVGEYEGLPYMALEYCPGDSLAKKLAGRPMPIEQAAALAETLARAIHAAHAKGIIHRDLKPGNVLLTEDGTPKIADFGLARMLDVPSHTATGAVMGTACYMAPEQASASKSVGSAADVWALGAILYESLTGRPPFLGPTMSDTLLQVATLDPVPPSRLNPRVAPQLEALCLHCLQKDPAQRPASALQLAEQLHAWLAQAPGSKQASSTRPDFRRKDARPRWTLLVAGMLAATLLAALCRWQYQSTSPVSTQPLAVHPPQTLAPEPEHKAQPLSIDLKVWKLAPEGFNNRLAGQLGQDIYRVHLNDTVRVEARLSEPAYAYFLCFNPAENEEKRLQCFPSARADQQPDKLTHAGPDETITLDDGVGLQVFAVIASRRPLPPFIQWRKEHPALVWGKVPATSGVVWLADGQEVDGLYRPGFNRATEGQKGDKALIRKLAAQLKEMPGVNVVSVVGFAVDPAQ